MNYYELLDRVIETGIEAARKSYGDGTSKFEGSKHGFQLCHDLDPTQLVQLYEQLDREAHEIRTRPDRDVYAYWRARCAALEVEWVLNCMSAALGVQILSHLPTARAAMHVAALMEANRAAFGPRTT